MFELLDMISGTSRKFWKSVGGRAHVITGFRPSQYEADLVMTNSAQTVALASGVKLGQGSVRIANEGAAGENIKFAFGSTEANAISALNVASGGATTGTWMPSITDSPKGIDIFGTYDDSTYLAIANITSGDTQTVNVVQGQGS